MMKVKVKLRCSLSVALSLVLVSGCRSFQPIIMASRNGKLYYYTRDYFEARETLWTSGGGGQWFAIDPYVLLMCICLIGPSILFEKYIVSPIADTVMIPYDLCLKVRNADVCANEGVYIRLLDCSGRPMSGVEIDLIIAGNFKGRIIYDGKVCPRVGAGEKHVFTDEKGEAYVPIDLASCRDVSFSGWEQTSAGGEDFSGSVAGNSAGVTIGTDERDYVSFSGCWRGAGFEYVFSCPHCHSKGIPRNKDRWHINGECIKCGRQLSKREKKRRLKILSNEQISGPRRAPLPPLSRTGYLSVCRQSGLTIKDLEGLYGTCPVDDRRKGVLVRLKGKNDPGRSPQDLPEGVTVAKGTTVNDFLPYPVNKTVGLAVRREFHTLQPPQKIHDFDLFWDSAKAEMRKGWRGEVKVAEVADMSTPSTRVSRVEFDIAGRCVAGLLSEPKGNGPRKTVPTLAFFGRGPEPDVHGLATPNDRTVLYLSAFEPGYDYRRAERDIREKYHLSCGSQLEGYAIDGIDHGREAYFFYPVLSGALRAAEWLSCRENVKGVRCVGSDQGASLALMTAALSGHVVMVEAHHPEFVGIMDERNAWPKFYWHESSNLMDEVRKWMPYYELCGFASRVKCPVTLYLNLCETSDYRKRTPSISVFKALEKCEGRKLVIDNSLKASEALRRLVIRRIAFTEQPAFPTPNDMNLEPRQ